MHIHSRTRTRVRNVVPDNILGNSGCHQFEFGEQQDNEARKRNISHAHQNQRSSFAG